MNVLPLQVKLRWKVGIELGDKLANIERVCSLIDEACQKARPDLIVIPEFALTGPISTLADPDALVADDPKLDHAFPPLSAAARAHNVAIVMPLFLRERDGGFSNSVCWIDQTGNLAGTYRKIHPYPPEKAMIRPGRELCLVETAFGTAGLQICYDVFFPETARLLALRGATILVYPTFAEDRIMDRFALVARARAVENQVFVVVANAVGVHPRTGNTVSGRSLVVAPSGEVQSLGVGERVDAVRLDLSEVDEARNDLFTLRDRIPAAYAGLVL